MSRLLPALLFLLLAAPIQAQESNRAYLPYINLEYGADCGDITPKKALAWSYQDSYPFDYRSLCMPKPFHWQRWWLGYEVTEYHIRLPFVFAWGGWTDAFPGTLPAGYSGYIITCNEPEIATQGDMTPAEAAALMIWVHEQYPQAKIISCSHSGGAFVGGAFDWYPGQMWASYFQQGGQASWIYAVGGHCYNEHLGAVCVEKVRATLPVALQDKPVYVTEAGDCRDGYALALAGFNELFAHDDVVAVHGYTPRSDHECSRWRGLDDNAPLTNVGRAWRDSGKLGDLQ